MNSLLRKVMTGESRVFQTNRSRTRSSTLAGPRQPGTYDPADNRIRFDAPVVTLPGAYRSGTTGPQLILTNGPSVRSPIFISDDDDEPPENVLVAPGTELQSHSQVTSCVVDDEANVPHASAVSHSSANLDPVLGAAIINPYILLSPFQSDAHSQLHPDPQSQLKDYHHAGYYVTPGSGLTPPREDLPIVLAAPGSMRTSEASSMASRPRVKFSTARRGGLQRERTFSSLDPHQAQSDTLPLLFEVPSGGNLNPMRPLSDIGSPSIGAPGAHLAYTVKDRTKWQLGVREYVGSPLHPSSIASKTSGKQTDLHNFLGLKNGARQPPPKPNPTVPAKRPRGDDGQDDCAEHGAKRARDDPTPSRAPARKPSRKSDVPSNGPITPVQRARHSDDHMSRSGVLDFALSLTPLADMSAERKPLGVEVSPSESKATSPRKDGRKTYKRHQTLATAFIDPSSQKQDGVTGATGADPDGPKTQDAFKSLAKASKVTGNVAKGTMEPEYTPLSEPVPLPEPATTRRVTRSHSQAIAESQPVNPPPKGRKRPLQQFLQDESRGLPASIIPPPPKRPRRGVAPAMPTIESSPQASSWGTSIPHLQLTDRLDVACQPGGRVFAPSNKMYVTATIIDYPHKAEHSGLKGKAKANLTNPINCKIKFDDGTRAEIPLTKLRRCELHEGDEVCVPGKKGAKHSRTGHVSAVPLWIQCGTASIRTASKSDMEVTVVQGKDIGITLKVVDRDWDDRRISSVEEIELKEELKRVQEEKERAEEAKGKTSEPMTRGPPFRGRLQSPPLVRTRTTQVTGRSKTGAASSAARIDPVAHSVSEPLHDARLVGFAFILALGFRDAEGNEIPEELREKKKGELVQIITRHGGRVVKDGFDSLIHLGGQSSDDNARWIWNRGDVEFFDNAKVRAKVERYLLLADGANRNQKYMTALAAGIPCVNSRWISDGMKTSWRSYVLPAGECSRLALTCAQWIDSGHVDHALSLRDMHVNPGARSQPFKDKSLLFVYPSKAKTYLEEDKFSSTYAIAALACMMGTSRVEVVHFLKSASLSPPEYDIIVHEEGAALPASLTKSLAEAGAETIIAPMTWVSDCLISGGVLAP